MSNEELIEALVRQGYTLEEAQKIVAERSPVQARVLAKLTARQIRLLASADDMADGEGDAPEDDSGETLAEDMDIDVAEDSGFMAESDVTDAQLETAIQVIDAIADNILEAAGLDDFEADTGYEDVLDVIGDIVDVADSSGLAGDEGFDEESYGGDDFGEDVDLDEEEAEGGELEDEEVTARFIRRHLLSRRSVLIRRLGQIVSRRGLRALKSKKAIRGAIVSSVGVSSARRRGASLRRRAIRSNEGFAGDSFDVPSADVPFEDAGHVGEESLLGDGDEAVPVNPLGELVWDAPLPEEEVILPTEDKGEEPIIFQRVSRYVYVLKSRRDASRLSKCAGRVKPLRSNMGMYFYPSRTFGLIGIRAPLVKGSRSSVYAPFVHVKGGFVSSSGRVLPKGVKVRSSVVIAPVNSGKGLKAVRNGFDVVDYVTSSYYRARMGVLLSSRLRDRAEVQRANSRRRRATSSALRRSRESARYYRGVARDAVSELRRSDARLRDVQASRRSLESRRALEGRRYEREMRDMRRDHDRVVSSMRRRQDRQERQLEDNQAKAAIDVMFAADQQAVSSGQDKQSNFAKNVEYLSRMM